MKTIIFILGPTCTGKTDLGFFLAEKLKLPILNADSLQFYKGMDVGTAKPDWKKQNRISCYFFDHIDPPHIYTAGQFQKEAQEIIDQQKNHSLVVGGSGFYLQALEKGCYPIPPMDEKSKKDFALKEKKYGLHSLYKELESLDEDYARTIHKNDKYRIFRALQVIQSSGIKMSEIKKSFKKKNHNYSFLKIGLTGETSLLRERVSKRTHQMLQSGLIEEVKTLMNKNLENFPPLDSVGYKEVKSHLQGELSFEKLHDSIVTRTMQLIKKQKKWFQRDSFIHWYDCTSDYNEIYNFCKTEL